MNKKHLKLAIGIAISVAFIWYAFAQGGVTLEQMRTAFTQTNWLWAIPMLAVTIVSFYWRVFRWKILLEPTKDIPSGRLFGPMMLGFAFNNIFPARAGEFARPFALMKKEKVPYAAGFSTIVVERLIDVVTLLVLIVILPYIITLDPTVEKNFQGITLSASMIQSALPKMSILALIILTGIVSFMIPQINALYQTIIRKFPALPDKFRTKFLEMLESFTRGFDSLKNPWALARIAFHSVVVWVTIALSFQVMSWGFPGVNLNLQQAAAFMVVTCVVISIPSSPGFWGLYEFGGMLAIQMMGLVPNTEAGASTAFTFTLVVHLLQWIPTTLIGLYAAKSLAISAHDAEEAAEHPDQVGAKPQVESTEA